MNEPSDSPALEPRELARYSRHLVLPEVGIEGQRRLARARVLVVGAGGLGSPAALYLAAAGVGRIGLVDFDRVELSNLQRQVLYGTGDVGRQKLEVARARLADVNPHVALELVAERLTAGNALDLVRDWDVVLDGTDNFPTRYAVNDACVLAGKPNVYGSVFRFEGQVSVFDARRGPCYRCLFPEPPPAGAVPNCAEGGVLGILPGVIGTLQATEAIKLVLERGESLVGRLLLFDALEMRFRELRLRRDPACALCGERPTIRRPVAYDESCRVDPAIAGEASAADSLSVDELERARARGEAPLLLDVRTPEEWAICHLAGARLVPLSELPRRLGEIEPERDIVVYCHKGGRSAQATALLRGRGFVRARNLSGGIDAWAERIEPSMPRY